MELYDNNTSRLEVSPYDETYPVKLLSEAFDFRLSQANRVANSIYNDVSKHSLGDIPSINDADEKMRLVVDISDDTLKEIEEGKIKLVEENGKLLAQLRENGRYGEKLPIKEEIYKGEFSAAQMKLALQLQALQKSLAIISDQIKTIDESVREVINGQQNDRIGLYYSGVSLYIEASSVTDESMKKLLIAQAIKSLTESAFQLTLKMQSDILYLKNKEYESKKKNRFKFLNEKMNSINQCFSIIHQSYILKAAIYCQQGELATMINVLDQYSQFIKGTVLENASMLVLCDVNDTGKSNGKWKQRSKIKLDTSLISQSLLSNKEVYLGLEEE